MFIKRTDGPKTGLSLVLMLFASLLFVQSQAGAAELPDFQIGVEQVTVTVSGRVTDSLDVGLEGAEIQGINPEDNTVVANALTDSTGNYSLTLEAGVYDFKVIPPPTTQFGSSVTLGKEVSDDSILDFILISGSETKLSGRFITPDGTGLAGNTIRVIGGAVNETQMLDDDGGFSYLLGEGTYSLLFFDQFNTNDYPENLPPNFIFRSNGLGVTISESTVLDVEFPIVPVTVKVTDQAGNPIENVDISSNSPTQSNFVSGGISFRGNTEYPAGRSLLSDSNGEATFYLLPGPSPYTFSATPQDQTEFGPTNVESVIAEGDMIHITLASPKILSGRLFDPSGIGIASASVQVLGNTVNESQNLESDGSYAYLLGDGNYSIAFGALYNRNTYPDNLPTDFVYRSSQRDIAFTESTTFDVELPVVPVTVNVQDPLGNPVENVELTTSAPNQFGFESNGITFRGSSSYPIGKSISTDSSGEAVLYLLPGTRSYTISATPDSQSQFGATNVEATIVGQDEINITLSGPKILSGRLLHPNGVGLAGNLIQVLGGPINETQTLDNTGGFSVELGEGTYTIKFFGIYNADTYPDNLPTDFVYQTNGLGFDFSESTVLDIEIPLVPVRVEVQDQLGNRIEGVNISTNSPLQAIFESNGIEFRGNTGYPADRSATTNSDGVAELFLLPGSSPYVISLDPVTSSQFSITNITQVISGETQLQVILQFVNPQPVTTASLSPAPTSTGTYPDPVTVGLESEAAAGNSIAEILYSIDGEPYQSYTGPFEVTGAGPHTVDYYAIDNLGVTEETNTIAFSVIESETGPFFNFNGDTNGGANRIWVTEACEFRLSGQSVPGQPTYDNITAWLLAIAALYDGTPLTTGQFDGTGSPSVIVANPDGTAVLSGDHVSGSFSWQFTSRSDAQNFIDLVVDIAQADLFIENCGLPVQTGFFYEDDTNGGTNQFYAADERFQITGDDIADTYETASFEAWLEEAATLYDGTLQKRGKLSGTKTPNGIRAQANGKAVISGSGIGGRYQWQFNNQAEA